MLELLRMFFEVVHECPGLGGVTGLILQTICFLF